MRIYAWVFACAVYPWPQVYGQEVLSILQSSVTQQSFILMVGLGLLSLAPALVLMATSFTRFLVVFSLLRTALGLQQAPPNQIFVGLALFMTFFVMEPTFKQAYTQGVRPYIEKKITEDQALEHVIHPFHTFMRTHVRSQDLTMMHRLAKVEDSGKEEDVALRVLMPAFMISELRRAFEIGFLLFLPFMIIDVLVASVLMSLGMMMLPPVTLSFPLKLIFFVMVDGWHMLVGSLLKGYGV